MENKLIPTAWGHIQRAQAVRDNSTRMARENMDEFRRDKSVINDNRELSDQGKRSHTDKLRADYEVKTIQLSRAMYDEHDTALVEAAKCAEAALTQPLTKVDETERVLYMQKADELLAKAQFATTPKEALEALRALNEMTRHPSLAAEIKSQVFSMAQQITASTTNPSKLYAMKKELGDIYNALSDKAMPEGSKEAREILNIVKSMSQTPLFSNLVCRSLAEISPLARHYANTPQDYFKRTQK